MAESLSEALVTAAEVAFNRHKTLSTLAAKDFFCDEFLYRWVFVAADDKTLDPTSASGSHFFLFWKNLSVTNISFAELLSLIRTFSRERKTNDKLLIDFSSTKNYKEFFRNLWEAIFTYQPAPDAGAEFPETEVRRAVDTIVKFHAQFFQRTIIIDSYYTSVVAHIPASIKVDIRAVTIQSGYVHSSGAALYFRNIEKAEQRAIIEVLRRFFKLNPDKKFFITPYASEFFSPFEDDSSASIRNGLDGVRIQLRKHFIERESLLNFLNRLETLFPQNLCVPGGATDYGHERRLSLRDGATNESTLWFITDSGFVIDESYKSFHRSKDIYIVIYAQHYLNNNQLIIFKERKPAWVHSTTLPHTLSAAMINIARHHSELKRNSPTQVILDPFCGTGTTLFDSLLRFPNATAIGLDANQLMPLMVKHNVTFFSDPDSIPQLLSMLKSIEARISTALGNNSTAEREVEEIARRITDPIQPPSKTRVPEADFDYAFELIMRELKVDDQGISDASVSRVSELGFSENLTEILTDEQFPFALKIITYAIWRALLMNTFSMRTKVRSPQTLYKIIRDELRTSIREYNDFQKTLQKETIDHVGSFCTKEGSYSKEGGISTQSFAQMQPTELSQDELHARLKQKQKPGIYVSRVTDSIEFLGMHTGVADLIVTDPPYGFNTYGDLAEMQDLFSKLIPTLVQALSTRGQLMLAIPSYAKNGKRIPYYQTRDSIVRHVIGSVEEQKRRLIRYVETIPQPKALFDVPWYWGSMSTVERRIVHFMIE